MPERSDNGFVYCRLLYNLETKVLHQELGVKGCHRAISYSLSATVLCLVR